MADSVPTQPVRPPPAFPASHSQHESALPSYAAVPPIGPIPATTGADTPPPPPAYMSHRRLVLWPAPFPSSPDPLWASDVTSTLPSTDDFGAEEIRSIASGCCCQECEVRLLDDRRGKGGRMEGRVLFRGHGGVMWVWSSRNGKNALQRWPLSGTGIPGAAWRLNRQHEMVGLCTGPSQAEVSELAQDGNGMAAHVHVAAEDIALGDGGVVRVAVRGGRAMYWRTDSAPAPAGPASAADGDGRFIYLDVPSEDKIPNPSGDGWARWCPFTACSITGGERVDDVIRVAAGEVAVVLRANGEVWVGALYHEDREWHLLCIVDDPGAVGVAASGALVSLYRLPPALGVTYPHLGVAAAYVVFIHPDTEQVQVHMVRLQDTEPENGVLELALRPLSLRSNPPSAPPPQPERRGMSFATFGSERKPPSPQTERRMSFASFGTGEKKERKFSFPGGEWKMSFGIGGDEAKPEEREGEKPRRLSFATLRRASTSIAEPGPSMLRRPESSRSRQLSLAGYEAALRTASGEVYAWNQRWPVLPSDIDSDSPLDERESVIFVPSLRAQHVDLPPGERESTLFPVSLGVRCALCVTVGEEEEGGLKEKVKRALKGKGGDRITLTSYACMPMYGGA